jgi:DNA/RNA-binding domain of Phe-tRNA-synthetase-like protein
MFMAELESQLLTAGHDAGVVEPPILVDVSKEGETFVTLIGQTQTLQPGDMVMRDARGVISSVLYGPDQRTRLRPETQRAVFAVYAPVGIGSARVSAHLHAMAANVRVVAPDAIIVSLEVLSA